MIYYIISLFLTLAQASQDCKTTLSAKLTSEDINMMYMLIDEAYAAGEKFEAAMPKVKAAIGEPDKTGSNMFEWYFLEDGKIKIFFVTKANNGGHMARGRYEQ